MYGTARLRLRPVAAISAAFKIGVLGLAQQQSGRADTGLGQRDFIAGVVRP